MIKSRQTAQSLPPPLTAEPKSKVIHSVVAQLEASQWLTPEQLNTATLQQLKLVLQHAQTHSGFYRDRLQGLDIEAFELSDLAAIPVLTRAQLQQVNARIDASVLPPDHGKIKETMTSGSTATPVRIRTTGVTALMWNAINLREHLWHQRDTRQVSVAVRWRGDNSAMYPDGITLSDWGPPVNLFYQTAPCQLLNSAVAVEQQKLWLERIQPAYLMSHPSNVAALAEVCRPHGHGLTRLQQIRTVGETVTAQLRQRVNEIFGVPVVDIYSSQELGYIALQCPEQGHYHVQAESLLVEILREDGTACAPYEIGKVVISSLRNYATPLLRYEVGDYAAFGERCSCGRGLPVLHAIGGRVRNMVVLPDGSRHWPDVGFLKMMDVVELRQFQVVQTSLECIELRVVVDSPVTPRQEARLQQVLRSRLGYPFQITISYHGELRRSAGGKFEDFVSLVAE